MTDLISRQAALEMFNDNELERQADDVFDGDLHRYKRAAQRIIAQLPSAEKHGKWMHDADGLVWCYGCGFGKERSDERPYNYCPNCGAKMDADISEEEIRRAYGTKNMLFNCGARMEGSEE